MTALHAARASRIKSVSLPRTWEDSVTYRDRADADEGRVVYFSTFPRAGERLTVTCRIRRRWAPFQPAPKATEGHGAGFFAPWTAPKIGLFTFSDEGLIPY
jgi:hypothetical protein